ncbi:hypothetical protein EA187_07005 [Lujinxingia sediminis]|uniref:RCC1-like domain-containing protein n=2 Tax=Lujinxingia sediminis TaxID=2480984 RepID=A0ABY0CUX8_9DELT|nr:hypothetical protein EA187_07005 [Lujinxingia sediminis]
MEFLMSTYLSKSLPLCGALIILLGACTSDETPDPVDAPLPTQAPGVAIASPDNGAELNDATVDVTLALSGDVAALRYALNDTTPAEILLDRVVADYTFELNAKPGSNVLWAEAIASDGRTARDEIAFWLSEDLAPEIVFETSATAPILEDEVLLIATITSPGGELDAVELRVNENDVAFSEDALTLLDENAYTYSFETTLTLGDGENLIELSAHHGEASVTETLLLTRGQDTEAPTLAGINLPDGASVESRQPWLSGRVTDNVEVAELRLLKEGADAAILTVNEDGTFGAPIDLLPGSNAFTLEAEDVFGNTTSLERSLYFGARTSAGGSHTGVILNGQIFAWGRNNKGQAGVGYTSRLGDSDPAHPDAPMPVSLGEGEEAVALAFGQNSSLALSASGQVYAWGDNGDGQLCVGTPGSAELDEEDRLEPTLVTLNEPAIAIFRGNSHSLILGASGQVYACGDNGSGQLGDGTTESRDLPTPVEGLEDVIAIRAGSASSYALTASGQVYAWGRNSYGNLASGTDDSDAHPTPALIEGLEEVVDLANGRDHVVALTRTGELFGWGLNASNQLGEHPDWDDGEVHQVEPLTTINASLNLARVGAGGNQSFVITAEGLAYGWGQNGFGNLGTPTEDDLNHAQDPVFGLVGLDDLGVGALHSVALRNDGRIFTWGWSFQGSLGAGESAINAWSYRVPVLVDVEAP